MNHLEIASLPRYESNASDRDPRFAALVAAVGHPSVELRDSTFEAIARAITYQQLAGAAAGAIWGRVLALFPDEGELDPSGLVSAALRCLHRR